MPPREIRIGPQWETLATGVGSLVDEGPRQESKY